MSRTKPTQEQRQYNNKLRELQIAAAFAKYKLDAWEGWLKILENILREFR